MLKDACVEPYVLAMQQDLAHRRHRAQKGAALVEYGALVGLIAVVSITAVLALSDEIDFNLQVAALNTHEITNELGNYLVNGDFTNTSGMTATAWGFSATAMDGWVSKNGRPFELHTSGWQGVDSVFGDYWLDTNASPGAMDIEQFVTGLIPGDVYKLTVYGADRDPDLDGEARVFWNGEQVGIINPDQEDVMQIYTFHVRSGAGDGQDRLRIIDTGANDSNGISLDGARLWGV